MQVSTEHLLQQAHERFGVQDYYGTVHLLDEILESGRRFADVYHLRALSLSLLGQPEKALEDFDRALAVNSRYVDALVHRGVILVELGRSAEADASFQRAVTLGRNGGTGYSRPVASRLANMHAGLGDAYADPKDKTGKAAVVDIAPVSKLARPVTLAEIKADAAFATFALVRLPRLSVMPVSDAEWERIQKKSR